MLPLRHALPSGVLALALAALSCTADAQSPLIFTTFATGLSSPVDIQHAPGDSTRVFIVQQGGLLRVVENGTLLAGSALNLTTRITSGGEQGFLGLAFDPAWPDSAFIYVNFTRTSDGANTVARYTRAAGAGVTFTLASERVLLAVPDPFSNHNAGALAFGPDGYLYITMGDGGSGGDPNQNGQNLNALLAKILRIDVHQQRTGTVECSGGSLNYAVPPSNPFVAAMFASCDEIYAYGFRNPWRMSFDRDTGALWVGDVGQESWEEVDVVEIGGNYGWRRMEGTHCFSPSTGCQTGSLLLPVWEYSSGTGSGNCSVTGGYVYRGENIPSLFGKYVYADYCSGRVWSLDLSGPIPSNAQIGTRSSPTTFGEDYYGEIYVAAGNTVYRIDPSPVRGEDGPERSALALSIAGPHPVAARSALRMAAAAAGPARLVLLDVLGREVAVLFDGLLEVGAPTEVALDAAALAPGVYVARLVTQTASRSLRVVVAR